MTGEFFAGVVAGILATVSAALILGGLRALTEAPGKLERALRLIERTEIDREAWLKQQNEEHDKEIDSINEDCNARGIYDSSIRLNRIEEINKRYLDEYVAYTREFLRTCQDTGPLGWLEKRLYDVKYRKKKRTPLEEQLLAGITRPSKQQPHPTIPPRRS